MWSRLRPKTVTNHSVVGWAEVHHQCSGRREGKPTFGGMQSHSLVFYQMTTRGQQIKKRYYTILPQCVRRKWWCFILIVLVVFGSRWSAVEFPLQCRGPPTTPTSAWRLQVKQVPSLKLFLHWKIHCVWDSCCDARLTPPTWQVVEAQYMMEKEETRDTSAGHTVSHSIREHLLIRHNTIGYTCKEHPLTVLSKFSNTLTQVSSGSLKFWRDFEPNANKNEWLNYRGNKMYHFVAIHPLM